MIDNINPEDLAYWYFRLNGFFTIPNFIVHEDVGRGQRTDVDIFGVRFPYRAELLENAIKDDEPFTNIEKPYIIIVEVKIDRCGLNGPWTDPTKKNMHRILHALGVFCLDKDDYIAEQLYKNGFYEDERYVMSLVCVGRRENPEYLRRYPRVPQITWEKIAKFIYNRFFHYYEQKSINHQWDQTGKLLWRLFLQCSGEQDGQLIYTTKIINSLRPKRQEIIRNVESDLDEKMLHALYFIRKSPQRKSVFEIANVVELKIEQTHHLLQSLLSKGYIKQDRRDKGEPFDPFSTYFTVPLKREEIDKLLKEDFEKVVMQAEQPNFLSAGGADKVLACVDCLTYYKKGTTFCRKCLGKVHELDIKIADIIFCLNAKGYKTSFSCAGHVDIKEPYISFHIDMSDMDPPRNFTWDSSHKTLRMIPYHKIMGISKKKMEQTITKETLEQLAQKNLETLRTWAMALPMMNTIKRPSNQP